MKNSLIYIRIFIKERRKEVFKSHPLLKLEQVHDT